MKQKKILALILAGVLALSLAACSGGDGSDASGSTAPSAAPSQAAEPTDTPEPEDTPEPGPTAIPLSIGDSIDNDNFLMTFDSMELLDEYKYSTSEYSSTSLYVEDGYKLVVVKGHFENKATSAITDSAFSLSALVNGSYELDEHDVRMNFQRDKYFEIDAYTDQDYVLYINIPNKLAEQFEAAEFTIGFNDDLSTITTVYNSDGTKTVEVDQLYKLSGTVGTAAPVEDGGGETSATEGLWSVNHYVDDFQQPTEDWFIANNAYFEGTFSNSATTNSKLLVQVAADEFEGETRVAFFLYEYGRNQVKNSSSNYVDEYTVTMRDASGNDVEMSGTVYCGGDRLFIDDQYVNTVLEAMKGEGSLSFHIVDTQFATTSYLFTFETDNFGSLYAETAG